MYSDEYLRLVEDAQDSLYALLRASEPGTNLTLHHAYNELKRTLKAAGEQKLHLEQKHLLHEYRTARRREKEAWERITVPAREHLALELIGDERVTITGLTERMEERLPECGVHRGYVEDIVRELFKRGDLDRDGLPQRGYRYFRRQRLEGPIADLERSFHEEEAD